MNKNIGSILIFVFLISLLSCSTKNDLNKDIQGQWYIKNAARNGRITFTLEGAYINLYDNKSLETNIFGEPLVTGYILKENTIIPDSFLSEIFVDKISDDTLWLHMTLSNNFFSLQLLNKTPDEKITTY